MSNFLERQERESNKNWREISSWYLILRGYKEFYIMSLFSLFIIEFVYQDLPVELFQNVFYPVTK